MMSTIFLIPGLMTVTVAGQEDLPTSFTTGRLAGVVLVGLAFLLTPVAQVWAVTRLADRWRRPSG